MPRRARDGDAGELATVAAAAALAGLVGLRRRGAEPRATDGGRERDR